MDYFERCKKRVLEATSVSETYKSYRMSPVSFTALYVNGLRLTKVTSPTMFKLKTDFNVYFDVAKVPLTGSQAKELYELAMERLVELERIKNEKALDQL